FVLDCGEQADAATVGDPGHPDTFWVGLGVVQGPVDDRGGVGPVLGTRDLHATARVPKNKGGVRDDLVARLLGELLDRPDVEQMGGTPRRGHDTQRVWYLHSGEGDDVGLA